MREHEILSLVLGKRDRLQRDSSAQPSTSPGLEPRAGGVPVERSVVIAPSVPSISNKVVSSLGGDRDHVPDGFAVGADGHRERRPLFLRATPRTRRSRKESSAGSGTIVAARPRHHVPPDLDAGSFLRDGSEHGVLSRLLDQRRVRHAEVTRSGTSFRGHDGKGHVRRACSGSSNR